METLPEAKIPTTGGPETKAAGADGNAEQAASDLLPAGAGAEATARPVPEPTKPNIPPLGTDAAAAGIVIRSSNEDPDQVASDLRLAEDYAGAVGGPVPPLALVTQYRDSFRQTLQEAQNAKILSEAPFLADWMLSPENTALAGDDLQSLGWFSWLRTLTFGEVDTTKPGDGLPSAEGGTPSEPAPPQPIPEGSTLERVGLEFTEAGKAVPGGALVSLGKAAEGGGQLLELVVAPIDSSRRDALAAEIIRAGEIADKPELVYDLRQRILRQGDINPTIATSVLYNVVAGDETPEGAAARLGAPLRTLASGLKSEGIRLQDKGTNLYRPTPGMEDGFGWKFGTAVGSALPGAVVGAVAGPRGAMLYGGLEGAGDASSAARKAHQDEATQRKAAFWGFIPGALGAIPPLRLVRGFLPKGLPQAGAAKFLTDLAITGVVSGFQSGGKQLGQNSIAKSLYAPDKSLFDGVIDNGVRDGAANVLLAVAEAGVKAAFRGRIPSVRVKTATPGDAVGIAEISAQALASKLRQRDPEKFRQFVAQVTANTPIEYVYVPAREFLAGLREHGFNDAGVSPFHGVGVADLNSALAANGNLKIPTATYAAAIANSELNPFFIENARFSADGSTPKETAELLARTQELMKDAEKNADANYIDDEAHEAVEGTAKDAETARVNRKARRFVKEPPGDGEAVNVEEQARRAVEGTDSDAEIAPFNGKATRKETKTSGNTEAVDLNEQARRAVEGFDKGAEAARVNRKARRIQKNAP